MTDKQDSAEQPQPVSGWRLVPVEPTEAMKRAAVVYANGNAVYKNVAAEALAIEEGIYGETYEAMLAAAPPPPAAPCPHIRSSGTGEWATNWCALSGPPPPAAEPSGRDMERDAVDALVEDGWTWDGNQWQRPPPAAEPITDSMVAAALAALSFDRSWATQVRGALAAAAKARAR
jgi:hypothetical protein